MVYRRRRRSFRRRFRRPRRFLRRRRVVRYTRRMSKRNNKWLAPMLPYNPVQARSRIVKVVYDYTTVGNYILVNKGASVVRGTDIYATEPLIRCNNPEAPCVSASGGGDTKSAHGVSYWASLYKTYQVLRTDISVKVTPHWFKESELYNRSTRVVFQLRAGASDFDTQTDWEVNQFMPTTVTRFLPFANPNFRGSIFLRQSYQWKSLHGNSDMPEVRAFGVDPTTGDQDRFSLYLGNETKANNSATEPSVPFNVKYRVVYTMRLQDPKAIDTNYPVQGTAPSAAEAIAGISKYSFAPSGSDGEVCEDERDEADGELCGEQGIACDK